MKEKRLVVRSKNTMYICIDARGKDKYVKTLEEATKFPLYFRAILADSYPNSYIETIILN